MWVVKSSPGVEDPEREAAKFYQPPQSTWTELQAGETNVVITQAQNSVECSSGSTNVVLESDSVLLIVLLCTDDVFSILLRSSRPASTPGRGDEVQAPARERDSAQERDLRPRGHGEAPQPAPF